jgi:hypothetical protein
MSMKRKSLRFRDLKPQIVPDKVQNLAVREDWRGNRSRQKDNWPKRRVESSWPKLESFELRGQFRAGFSLPCKLAICKAGARKETCASAIKKTERDTQEQRHRTTFAMNCERGNV